MLCSNGHNNVDDAKFCATCGVNTFQAGTQSGFVSANASSASTNGMAIASMVLGILWIYWIGSVLALIFGYIARRQIRENGQKGDGMALAGIILGWIGIGTVVLVIIIAIAANHHSSTNY
jgi:hypothetical protein